ncbi:MAG: response regulator transcription factor [Alphaproteobacteria bacterium]|nr:response regulator transcription factor [Alphaproteobacteria bacterium]
MKILLVDDHAIVRDGVRRLLQTSMTADIIEATGGQQALQIVQDSQPDLVLLDLNLDGMGGLEFIQRAMKLDSPVRIVVLSMHSEPAYVTQALKAGAVGYVSKAAPPEEVIAAAEAALAGKRYIERDLRTKLGPTNEADPLDKLTLRELEILRLLGRGESLTSIAELLGIAYKTVANTCTQMKHKLGLERTADLIRVALGGETVTKK